MSYEIKLDIFQGPLDLLLHLIEKEEIDIYNIPIAVITERYLEYLHTIQLLNLDGVGDFLVMAATLMQIKARLLLPQREIDQEAETEEEEDPRFELARKLIEYKKIKDAAVILQALEQKQFTIYTRVAGEFPDRLTAPAANSLKEMSVWQLFAAFKLIIEGMEVKQLKSAIPKPEISIKQCMVQLLDRMMTVRKLTFQEVFSDVTTKAGLITGFLAVLELLRLRKLIAYQEKVFGPIILTLPGEVGNGIESDAS